MTTTFQDATHKTANESRKIGDDVAGIAGRMAAGASDAADTVRKTIRDTADAAGSTLEKVGARTDELTDAAMKKGSELQSALTAEIKASPLLAVGIAFGIGFLFAQISRAA